MNSPDYLRIEQAIRYLEEHSFEQPGLDEIAGEVGLSPHHFQRLFKRWAGISPKRFLQYLTIESAKQRLRDSASVLETAYDVGLSGPGRLHDLFVNVEAVTPGEYRNLGRNLEIRCGIQGTPFGECLVAESNRGLCSLEFIEPGTAVQAREALIQNWPHATIVDDPAAGKAAVEQIFSDRGKHPGGHISLLLKGTNFQLKVWKALLRIPEGKVVTYGTLADVIGHPGANRAVGNAVGRNPIACLIPCHRVLRATGETGGYKWGQTRKKALLATEAIRTA